MSRKEKMKTNTKRNVINDFFLIKTNNSTKRDGGKKELTSVKCLRQVGNNMMVNDHRE